MTSKRDRAEEYFSIDCAKYAKFLSEIAHLDELFS